jgi:hypothetical protein
MSYTVLRKKRLKLLRKNKSVRFSLIDSYSNFSNHFVALRTFKEISFKLSFFFNNFFAQFKSYEAPCGEGVFIFDPSGGTINGSSPKSNH